MDFVSQCQKETHTGLLIHWWHKTHRAEKHDHKLGTAAAPLLTPAFVGMGGSQLSSQPSQGSLCQCFRNKHILVAKSPWEMLGSSSQALEPPCVAELPPRFPLSHTGRCILPAPGKAEKELVPLPKKTSSKGRKTYFFKAIWKWSTSAKQVYARHYSLCLSE